MTGKELRRPTCGRATGRVEAMKLLAVPQDGVGVGADAVGHRLDQRERNGSGKDRVDSAATGGEHLQTGLGGKRLRSRYDVGSEQRLAWPRVRVVPGERGHVCLYFKAR